MGAIGICSTGTPVPGTGANSAVASGPSHGWYLRNIVGGRIGRPSSRGFVKLRSGDPADKPIIKPNYLATDEDRRIAANSIRLTRRIASQPALARFHRGDVKPGSLHTTKTRIAGQE